MFSKANQKQPSLETVTFFGWLFKFINMKTAMQELIESLEQSNKQFYADYKKAKGHDKEVFDHGMSLMTVVIMRAKNILKKKSNR